MCSLTDDEYYRAAIADAVFENLTISAVQAAHDVSETAEQFFWAVQASVWLKGLCDAEK